MAQKGRYDYGKAKDGDPTSPGVVNPKFKAADKPTPMPRDYGKNLGKYLHKGKAK